MTSEQKHLHVVVTKDQYEKIKYVAFVSSKSLGEIIRYLIDKFAEKIVEKKGGE